MNSALYIFFFFGNVSGGAPPVVASYGIYPRIRRRRRK
jgi:hypothetical protein